MPYFIYRLHRHGRTEKVAVCTHFEQALAQQRALHSPGEMPHAYETRVIYADDATHAEDLLQHHRSPEEGLIGEP